MHFQETFTWMAHLWKLSERFLEIATGPQARASHPIALEGVETKRKLKGN